MITSYALMFRFGGDGDGSTKMDKIFPDPQIFNTFKQLLKIQIGDINWKKR